jgi:hypothetical protein
MAADRPAPTAIDHVTVILSPALIMGLVGSLVLFLLEILYKSDGEWRFRLQWILFFYVFGVVLTARISMNGETAKRAPLYGLVLALLTYIGMQSFIEYPPHVRAWSFLANLVLIVVVWWTTYRLVWDCTNVDEDVESSAEGLLQAAGIEEKPPDPVPDKDEEGRPLGFLERWRVFSEKARKGRTLGVWVVYFSLAALPIFGLGQALLPLTSPERRVWAFQLMAVYLACGIGLLLTTCFLGLRRYLRQRRLQMPAAMTAAWLTTGGGMLAGLIVVAALLPRPYSENALVSDWQAGSKKREASNFSPKGDSPAEGKGTKGETKDNKGDPGNKSGKDGDPGKDAKDSKDKGGKDGKGSKDKDGKAAQKGDEKGDKSDNKSDQAKSSDFLKNLHQAAWMQNLAPWLKWIVYAVILVAVVVMLFRHGLAFFANFSEWAKRWLAWWNGLLGQRAAAGAEGDDEPIEADPDTPFAAFANPYESGAAGRMTPRQLVRYTFAALEAWGRERGVSRDDHETAQEFVARLVSEFPALEKEAKALLRLYTVAEYARGEAPGDVEGALRAFWAKLDRATTAPASA